MKNMDANKLVNQKRYKIIIIKWVSSERSKVEDGMLLDKDLLIKQE